MELFHYHVATGNFGDDLNLWFWDAVLPGWRDTQPDDHLLIGIGTLLNDRLPAGRPKLIMGSGVGYGGALPSAELLAESRIVSVRGPRSARELGLPAQTGVVDPAVLIADLPQFSGIEVAGRPIFVPHLSSVNSFDWAPLCARAGLDYVSPTGDSHDVIRRIAAAPLVIAESMHAAILADAFRRPWHALSISLEFNDFKWADWADSLEIALDIQRPAWARGRSTTGPSGGPRSGGAEAAAGGPQTLRQRLQALNYALRRQIKARMLVRQFKDLAATPGHLSQTGTLEARKAELRRRFTAALPQLAA